MMLKYLAFGADGNEEVTLGSSTGLFLGWILLFIYTLYYAEGSRKNWCALGLVVGVIVQVYMAADY